MSEQRWKIEYRYLRGDSGRILCLDVDGPETEPIEVVPESELSLSLAREQRLRDALREIAECSFFPTRPVGEQVVYGLEGGPVKARMVAPVDSAVWMRERAREALSSVPHPDNLPERTPGLGPRSGDLPPTNAKGESEASDSSLRPDGEGR